MRAKKNKILSILVIGIILAVSGVLYAESNFKTANSIFIEHGSPDSLPLIVKNEQSCFVKGRASVNQKGVFIFNSTGGCGLSSEDVLYFRGATLTYSDDTVEPLTKAIDQHIKYYKEQGDLVSLLELTEAKDELVPGKDAWNLMAGQPASSP